MAKDLMLTVLITGKTGKELWNHLKSLFRDNKGNGAANLESKFVNLRFVDCNNVDDYCDKLQALSNRPSDLDFPMDEKRLVIQLVNGLPKEYNTVASFIQQSMPSFDTARSQLRTEEIRREHQSNSSSHTALAAANNPRLPPAVSSSASNRFRSASVHHRSEHSPLLGHQAALLPTPPGPRHHYPNAPNWAPQWTSSPSPYSAVPYWSHRHSISGRGRGRHFRGRGRGRGRSTSTARSPQAYVTPTTEYLQPSDIAEAYSSMSIRAPDDDFYMDNGATSHITSDPGNLHNVFPSSNVRSILVGNGSSIPVIRIIPPIFVILVKLANMFVFPFMTLIMPLLLLLILFIVIYRHLR
ncbi:uncharacterized protein LOC113300474 [Papaver somniferum]|uniref:uncharacterized protein LOC113300474 n=1 Tax=Papaver somniferum TaxID=3469 RepID=UPI000E6F55BA|nr:uncharacterized protein LOC113300474 [Papaver somniferum]